ncbi:hypothetical protein NUW58_g7079 [Xylaria curta]|uniref:Uncharacterized protein n=1 Tax=Xylaria curta TaxID=42375 RepID=A0ACC1NN40_9PEZI|nr:hypothetical protein NUW58_g7079 [Xylaria curta]
MNPMPAKSPAWVYTRCDAVEMGAETSRQRFAFHANVHANSCRMDPVTIVQIVGTAVSFGDVVIKCIAGLRLLKTKYHDAPLVISTIIGQLYMVQSALDQLARWNKPEHAYDPRYRQLAGQIDNALDCFSLLITALEQQLQDFELASGNNMTTKQRLTFLWSEKGISDFSVLLDRQVNALNLLLQAVQCNTLAQQQNLLLQEGSQSILQQAKDCSSSVTGLEDSASIFSENTAGISLMFDFDAFLLGSKVYQQAGRSHLRQAIKAHNQGPAPDRGQPKNNYQETSSQLGEPSRQVSPSIYPSSEAPSLQTQASAAKHPNSSNLQLAPNTRIEVWGAETNLSPWDSSPRNISKPSNRARILSLVNPWRKSLKPETTTPKFLILGTAESGKSTLLQGMKLLLEGNYTREEKLDFREIIWSNIVQSIRIILENMEFFELPLDDERTGYHVQTIFMQPANIETTPNSEVVEAILALWLDTGFQSAYKRRHEYQVNDSIDSTAHYVEEIQRLTALDYIPTDEDLLWARRKTTGIRETWFSDSALLQGLNCSFLDVGGARVERRKWIHGFENTSMVLFTIDTTAYAKRLFGVSSTNRMEEQLRVFCSIVNSRWFSKSAFVLIFTKMDLIEEWLQREPVEKHLPDYPYRNSTVEPVERYTQYLTDKFLSQVNFSEIATRIRIVQGSLTHDNKNTVSKVLEAINELAPRVGH